MSAKEYFHDLDLVKVSQLINARVHNVDNAGQAALAATLGADNKGLVIWNTEASSAGSAGALLVWDGTQFVQQAVEIEGDLIFRGVLMAADYTAVAVDYTDAGSQYAIGEAGTLTITGVTTYVPSPNVQAGDQIVFTAPDTVYVIQRNDEEATESTLGNVQLATQAEVNTGTQASHAVTPATLQGKLVGQKYVKCYSTTLNLTALTPATVTHNLNLADRDEFTINVMRGNSQISVDVDSLNVNSLTLTSLVGLTGVKVTVQGASAA